MKEIEANKEIIRLYSTKFELSECESDPDVYIGKFVICDFLPNENEVQLDRATISDWLPTLINKPLVGKIAAASDGTKDFTSHNMKVVVKVDDYGNEYKDVEFDTSAFGAFYEAGIEEIDGAECIVASAKIWKRFSEACGVIKSRAENGSLHTSWEITVLSSRTANLKGVQIKIIEQGSFFGHCLLGKSVAPAYASSKLLNVAEKVEETDNELETALIRDVLAAQKEENEGMEKNKSKATGDTTETSALTEWDLRDRIREACRAKLGKWCWLSYHFPVEKTVWVEVEGRESELDYAMFAYTVENDAVAVSEPTNVKLTVSVSEVNTTIEKLNSDLQTRDNTIIELNGIIQNLSSEVSGLTQYKAQFEEAEGARIAAEAEAKRESLKTKILQSNALTAEEIEASEEIKAMIENLDENGVNSFVVEKIISSLNEADNSAPKTVVQTAAAQKVKSSIVDGTGESCGDEKITPAEFIKSYIGR